MVFERNRKRIRSRRNERTAFIRHIALGIAVLLGVGLVLSGLYHITRLEMFTIQTISVDGGETISLDQIRQDVEAELRGSYWRLVPYTFSFTYPHDRIIKKLETYPRLHTPNIIRHNRTHLSVHFEEYTPQALLCSRNSEDPCYFVSADGFAFEEAPVLQGGALVRYIEEDRERVMRGDNFSSERLNTAQMFIESIETELGFRIGSVTYTQSGDALFAVNGGGVFKIDTTKPIEEAFANIRSVLQTSEYAHIEPGNFQYIDARFPPKIFVNETFEPVATTTETLGTSSDPEI